MRILGVIPARYDSSRLPGKPLADICGKPMIWWVYQRVQNIEDFSGIYVATDDQRILDACVQFQIPVIMTSKEHTTGAERIWEVSEKIQADFYIQINGDEPLIDPEAVRAVIPDRIPEDREFGSNIISEMREPSQVMDPSNIKVVFDEKRNALYMSRTPIPYPFKRIDFVYYKHVGIIGYNKRMLDFYKYSEPGRFEKIEGIDTLRFIDYAKTLQLRVVKECRSLSVDTEKDLVEIRRRIARMEDEKGGQQDAG